MTNYVTVFSKISYCLLLGDDPLIRYMYGPFVPYCACEQYGPLIVYPYYHASKVKVYKVQCEVDQITVFHNL